MKLQSGDHEASPAASSSGSETNGKLDGHSNAKRVDAIDFENEKINERRASIQTASDQGMNDDQMESSNSSLKLTHTNTRRILRMRAQHDLDPTDWWFASTAIPLIAATFAPMANMLSIAALVVFWRNDVTSDDPLLRYQTSVGVPDPSWCFNLNAVSLTCGFVGNLFLLFNFTQRVRYIIALPVTIFFFYLASGILIGIIVSMDQYTPPTSTQVYSQGYWHAVIAAILYMLNSMMLMVNMLGYFWGHYPQHFTLNDEQRNLIMQTMLFFLWLGGGAGVFARTQHWDYPDALYFCDVTILTIGFGDYFAKNDVGRGLVFPFSVGGTIILGLMVSSLHKFARELSKDKVVRKHVERRRVDTLNRAVTLDQLDQRNLDLLATGQSIRISRPLESDREKIQRDLDILAKEEQSKRTIVFQDVNKADFDDTSVPNLLPVSRHADSIATSGKTKLEGSNFIRTLTYPLSKSLTSTTNGLRRVTTRNQKQILMLEERDRFNAMRSVQVNASRFKRYYALTMSVISFGMLWCLGALIFHFAELETQQLTYFQGLYFCYVSLLTIGYGDLSPRSNAGKAFFVVWSLIAVPMMTILVSDLGDTVIGGFKRGVLKNDLGLTSSSRPEGRATLIIRRLFPAFAPHPHNEKVESNGKPSTVEDGLVKTKSGDRQSVEDMLKEDESPKTITELANEEISEAEMMSRLAFAIRRVADDLKNQPGKKYRYEEWVEFTRLIRFSKLEAQKGRGAMKQLEYDEAVDGVVEWDWLDENSPMASEQTESEWLLDRLCESLLRIFKRSDLLNGILGTDESKNKNIFSSPIIGQKLTFPYGESHDATAHASSAAADRDAQDEAPKNAVAQFLQGETSQGNSAKWSKRAHARMAAAERAIRDRRRSSASVRGQRHGPFAAMGARSGSVSADGPRTLKALAMYGSGSGKRDGKSS